MRADLARRHRQALPPCRDVHSGTFVLPRLPSTFVRRVKVTQDKLASQVKSSLWHFVLGRARPSARQTRPPWPS
jgi:hypothetical protein